MLSSSFPPKTIVYLNNTVIVGAELTVYGKGNKIPGMNCTVKGNNNIITGMNSRVVGNNNTVKGMTATVIGNNNTVTGRGCAVRGMNNKVTGVDCILNGNRVVSIVATPTGSSSSKDNYVNRANHHEQAYEKSCNPSNNQTLPEEHGFPRAFFGDLATSFPEEGKAPQASASIREQSSLTNPFPDFAADSDSRSRTHVKGVGASSPVEFGTFDNIFAGNVSAGSQPPSFRRKSKMRAQQLDRQHSLRAATMSSEASNRYDGYSNSRKTAPATAARKSSIRLYLEGRDALVVDCHHNINHCGYGVNTSLANRTGNDREEAEVAQCCICFARKRIVMSTCCRRVTSCIACARKMYENKEVGTVQCPNCQGIVREVYTVR